MKNRLQFNYYMPEKFPYTREQAVAFIESLFSTSSMESMCSLPAEPIIVFYGKVQSEASALIAIGRGGNGVDKPNNLPYYLVDYTKSVEDIDTLVDETGLLREDIKNIKDAIETIKSDIVNNKVKSVDKSVNVTVIEGEGTNLSVNIDNKTIIRNGVTGQLSVDSTTIRQPVNPNDKILTNDENGLHTTLSLKWVKNTNGSADEIQLLGKEGFIISRIDVADFIKDGILNGVKLETREGVTYIVFTFNTGEVIELNAKELIDVYNAGDGLQLVENVFSIKRDPNSDNFLTVSSDGIKISGVQAAIDNGIKSVEEKITILNSGVDTPGSVKNIFSQSVVANEVTNITPESVSGQTLLRRITSSGSIYASNRAIDIIYEAEDGSTSNVNILLRNLLAENAVLKEKVARLESIEYKEQLFTEFANRIYNGMTGVAMEIGVNKKYNMNNTNITGVEIGFADDALFQAGV